MVVEIDVDGTRRDFGFEPETIGGRYAVDCHTDRASHLDEGNSFFEKRESKTPLDEAPATNACSPPVIVGLPASSTCATEIELAVSVMESSWGPFINAFSKATPAKGLSFAFSTMN